MRRHGTNQCHCLCKILGFLWLYGHFFPPSDLVTSSSMKGTSPGYGRTSRRTEQDYTVRIK